MTNTQNLPIVLASSSPYRRELLLPVFPELETESPGVDEIIRAGEPPKQLAMRLASEKAQAVANRRPNSIVIGCDQVAALKPGTGELLILGKPGNFDTAYEQLSACQDKTVEFYSACCVINTRNDRKQCFVDLYCITFRPLDSDQIKSYLQREQPYDCAGSIKSEGLGASLIKAHAGKDPATLIGLPLIDLLDALANEGIQPL